MSIKKAPTQNSEIYKQWRDFCLNEFGLPDDKISDAFMMAAYADNLRKLDKTGGELKYFVSENGRRRMRELNIFFRENGETRVAWPKVQYFLSLLPPGKHPK